MSSGHRLQVFCLMILLPVTLIGAREIGRFKSGGMSSNATPVHRIIGGSAVPQGKHTYMAYLEVFSVNETDPSGYSIGACGGTLINEGLVLTAAHCFDSKYVKTEVYLGVRNIDPMDSDAIKRTVYKKNTIIHKEYDKDGEKENDIAILKLGKDIDLATYKDRVSTITLSGPNEKFDGETVIAVGWGTTSSGGNTSPNLLEAVLQVNTKEECEKQFRHYSHDFEICTVPSETQGTCQGDSGGPILDKSGTQIGITSYGPKKCEEGGVYTRISASVANNWIASVLKQDFVLEEEDVPPVGNSETNYLRTQFYMQPIWAYSYMQPFYYI